MKKTIFTIFLLYLSTISFATTPVQPLENLQKELHSLTPLKRILRASKHLDTMVVQNIPLPQISQRIDSLILFTKKIQDPELAGYLRFYDKLKGGLLPLKSEQIVAEFKTALHYFEKSGDNKYAGVTHFYLGKHYYDQGKFGDSFYHQALARQLFNKVGIKNIIDIGKYLHVMSLNYYHFGYFETVIELMRASLTLPAYNTNLDLQRNNTLAMAYQNLGKLDSAVYFLNRTKEIAISLHDTTWETIASGNLGRIFIKQGQFKEALPLIRQDYQRNEYKNRDPTLARNAALDIAKIWLKSKNQDSVLYYVRESERLHLATQTANPMWKEQRDEQYNLAYYEVIHEYYKQKGNTTLAYQYLDRLSDLRNESNLRYNKMTKQQAEDRLRIEQQLSDLSFQEAEKNRISTRLQFMIGIVGLIATIVSLLYYTLRLRRAKERILAEKQNTERLAETQQVKARLAEANLELKEYMLRVQEKNDLVQTFQSEIDHLKTTTTSHSPSLDELTSKLAEMKLLTLDDWNNFRQRFNQAFDGELDQLKLQYGNLTNAEERIYSLERLNVSTGQMAWMLGISPESVRKTRYRLRKKIGDTIV